MPDFNMEKGIARIRGVYRKIFPCIRLYWDGNAIVCSTLREDGWREVRPDRLPAITPLSRVFLVIASSEMVFRHREIPADLVSSKDLPEAITMDLDGWNYAKGHEGVFFLPVRLDERWSVAVWVWDAILMTKVREQSGALFAHITHIIPRLAWNIANISGEFPVLTVSWSEAEKVWEYCCTDALGIPSSVARVHNLREAMTFWRSIGVMAKQVKRVVVCEQEGAAITPPWLPSLPVEGWRDGVPTAKVLGRARCPGARDWSDPLVWWRHAGIFTVLLLIWMVAGGMISQHRQSKLDDVSQQVRSGAQQVLVYRQDVSRLEGVLEHLISLRDRQLLPMKVLGGLARYLPEGTQVISMNFHDSWLDIRGRGRNAAALGVILEQMPQVDHVSYIGDIRSDPVTGLETFLLRLHFVQKRASR